MSPHTGSWNVMLIDPITGAIGAPFVGTSVWMPQGSAECLTLYASLGVGVNTMVLVAALVIATATSTLVCGTVAMIIADKPSPAIKISSIVALEILRSESVTKGAVFKFTPTTLNSTWYSLVYPILPAS
jgi:hypothetical protein